jgi:hypothetical protein
VGGEWWEGVAEEAVGWFYLNLMYVYPLAQKPLCTKLS